MVEAKGVPPAELDKRVAEARAKLDAALNEYIALVKVATATSTMQGISQLMAREFELAREKGAFSGKFSFGVTVEERTGTMITDTVREDLPAPKSANDIVYQFISRSQGMRGVDIVSALGREGNPLPERTVRTTFHRLKKLNKIKVLDGRWYLFETDPAAIQPTLGSIVKPP